MKKTLSLVLAAITLLLLVSCGETAKPSVQSAVSGVLDRDGVKAEFKGFVKDEEEGDMLLLTVSNTSEKNVLLTVSRATVNGYLMDAYFYVVNGDGVETTFDIAVGAGETFDCRICFNNYYMKASGIDVIADAEFTFMAVDDDSHELMFDSEKVAVKNADAGDVVQTHDESGTQVCDRDGVKIVLKKIVKGEFGYDILVYACNTTGDDLFVAGEKCVANGAEVEPYCSSELPAGTRSVFSLGFEGEMNIEKLDEFKASFTVSKTGEFGGQGDILFTTDLAEGEIVA